MPYRFRILALVALLSLAGAAPVLAQCTISGNISAAPSGDPGLPAWTYTVTVTWDTDVQFALSHLDLLIDPVGGTCGCTDIQSALTLLNPAGSSDGEGGCTVDYDQFLECGGDPSIPGVDGILLKFEPIEEGCEPGTTGTAVLVFHSDIAPVPVDGDILSLVDKFANEYCFGNLSGEFPGLACNPVSGEDTAWGSVKGLYR
ncbi:MAG: hypothetical protein GY838_15545 [bacterium]|nr:hypothetical protein [bacterium]